MNILHLKCSLHVKQHIVVFALFCNKIIIVPMKSISSGVCLQATYSSVSLVNESVALNDSESQ